jgi:NAD+ synthase
MNYEIAIQNIRRELKDYLITNNLKSLVLGISGGIDSCLCATLAKPVCDVLGIPLIGRSLPITTNAQDEIDRAELTGREFCTNFRREFLTETFYKCVEINPDPTYTYIESIDKLGLSKEEMLKDYKIRTGNIKARIRMIFLYNLAAMNKGIVLSTDNYTELMLGFWTLHGDVGDYGMIQNLWKSEVYDIAEWLALNEYYDNRDAYDALMLSIGALATDGLGVTDTGDLGQILPDWKGNSRDGYKEVDRVLQVWEDRFRLGTKQQEIIESEYSKNPVIQRHKNTAFKRTNPVNISRAVILYGPSVR